MTTVLYVDDEPAILRMFLRTFGDEFNVITAASAEQGMAFADAANPDFVLADERMPVESGTSFLKRVKEKHPNVTVAIVSAYTAMQDTLQAIPHFFAKPYETKAMREFLASEAEPVVTKAAEPETGAETSCVQVMDADDRLREAAMRSAEATNKIAEHLLKNPL